MTDWQERRRDTGSTATAPGPRLPILLGSVSSGCAVPENPTRGSRGEPCGGNLCKLAPAGSRLSGSRALRLWCQPKQDPGGEKLRANLETSPRGLDAFGLAAPLSATRLPAHSGSGSGSALMSGFMARTEGGGVSHVSRAGLGCRSEGLLDCEVKAVREPGFTPRSSPTFSPTWVWRAKVRRSETLERHSR